MKMRLTALCQIATMILLPVLASGDDPDKTLGKPNPEELWSQAKKRGAFVYLEGVPAIASTSKTTPQATALTNVLKYLNTRGKNPWPCFAKEAMDALGKDIEASAMAETGKGGEDKKLAETIFAEKI